MAWIGSICEFFESFLKFQPHYEDDGNEKWHKKLWYKVIMQKNISTLTCIACLVLLFTGKLYNIANC